MLARIVSATTHGLEAIKISVEIDIAHRGLPGFQIVGLPSKAIEEARVRVISAIKNSGFEMPQKRITVNLAPAHIKKDGSLFDLPIALGILAAQNIINKDMLTDMLFVGELSLNGDVAPVAGIVPIVLGSQKWGIKRIFIPKENVHEASIVDGSRICVVQSVRHVIKAIKNQESKASPVIMPYSHDANKVAYQYDFQDIKGQHLAKRALEIAAAGGHNIQLTGPPGTGKTLLARALPSILPPMSKSEVIDVATIYSITRTLRGRTYFERPFRSPHHTISLIGMIGGGSVLKPGEISLAHKGVLFLDEFPEYPRFIIEALRQPLEDREVILSRASGAVRFPCSFMLVAASNPCGCGFLGHPTKECSCSSADLLKYKKKISGPILDRIDIHVAVPALKQEAMLDISAAETSESIRMRVVEARNIQKVRFSKTALSTNAEMGSKNIRSLCTVDKASMKLLSEAFSHLSLSPRSYFTVIKLAQTIADLSGAHTIRERHVAEALHYRLSY